MWQTLMLPPARLLLGWVQGTHVVSGVGLGVVVATGRGTYLSTLAEALTQASGPARRPLGCRVRWVLSAAVPRRQLPAGYQLVYMGGWVQHDPVAQRWTCVSNAMELCFGRRRRAPPTPSSGACGE